MNKKELMSIILSLIFTFSCTNQKVIKTVIIEKKDQRKTINLNLSDTLVISLISNPTTGYSWSIAESDTSLLKFAKEKYVPDMPQLTGSGGKEIFYYSSINEGRGTIKLIYSRVWEKKTKPADSLIANFQIKKSSD